MSRDDVIGFALGGVEKLAMAIENNVVVVDLFSGESTIYFVGDDEGAHANEMHGHTRQVTCLQFYGPRVCVLLYLTTTTTTTITTTTAAAAAAAAASFVVVVVVVVVVAADVICLRVHTRASHACLINAVVVQN